MERKKRKLTLETKEKISSSNKGKIVTEETKAKLKKARANRITTEETKQKISQGLIKYWKDVIWVDEIENNEGVKLIENDK